jgi:hypothetical protein
MRSPYHISVRTRATGKELNALFAGVWDVLDVAYTSLFESEAYNFTRLAPRPRVAPTTKITGIAGSRNSCQEGFAKEG